MGLNITNIHTPDFIRRAFVPQVRLNTGLYLVKGPNGVGKSVFLNTLIGFYGNAPNICKDDGSAAITSYFNQDSYASSESTYWNMFLSHQQTEQSQDLPQRAMQLLTSFGMSHAIPDLGFQLVPEHLSGGQLKKLGLVRTLLRPADLVLFDEPTNDLDQAAIQVMLDHVQALAQQISVVAITHDRALQALPHQDLRLFHD